ncbi:Activated RNA polymerase II transcriptional coactivator [Mycena chlorophos]|uniref:Activated RNA polymerase II transcriptional coactivator n=1 Tax=Mycena chlorophos TaxID=658473 RepID=A0A8H6RYF0_MYCCL|nr:Activated RNA polymerase II transcriptional coactivator [Mycena chlorophos]
MPPKRKSTDGDDVRPASKKAKNDDASGSEVEEEQERPKATVKKPKLAEKEKDSKKKGKKEAAKEEDKFVDLGKNKRVSVSTFKNTVLVDIREFYKDKETDEMKPGRKGISLTLEQYQQLKEMLDEVDALVEGVKEDQ